MQKNISACTLAQDTISNVYFSLLRSRINYKKGVLQTLKLILCRFMHTVRRRWVLSPTACTTALSRLFTSQLHIPDVVVGENTQQRLR